MDGTGIICGQSATIGCLTRAILEKRAYILQSNWIFRLKRSGSTPAEAERQRPTTPVQTEDPTGCFPIRNFRPSPDGSGTPSVRMERLRTIPRSVRSLRTDSDFTTRSETFRSFALISARKMVRHSIHAVTISWIRQEDGPLHRLALREFPPEARTTCRKTPGLIGTMYMVWISLNTEARIAAIRMSMQVPRTGPRWDSVSWRP